MVAPNDTQYGIYYAHLVYTRRHAEEALERARSQDVMHGGLYSVDGSAITVWAIPWCPAMDELDPAFESIGTVHLEMDKPAPGLAVIYAIEVDEGASRVDVEKHIPRLFGVPIGEDAQEPAPRPSARTTDMRPYDTTANGERAYIGVRGEDADVGGCRVEVREPDGSRRALRHVEYHSPTGYEWGYGGAGPADLALSILADALGEQPSRSDLRHGRARCWQLHQAFKWEIVAGLPRGGWVLPASRVSEWLQQHEGERGG